ncbi:MAG: hypothetical protein JWO97_3444 [Acidobacteria bacterium]|nr:hypothetical protein [Acidobacteriota bacterium]
MSDETHDPRELWLGQSTEDFRMSPDDIRRRINAMSRQLRRRKIIFSIIFPFGCLGFLWWITLVEHPLPQIGAILTIAGVAVTLWQVRKHHAADTSAAREMPSIDFYRAQLERARHFHGGAPFWIRLIALLPGPLLFISGFVAEHPEVAHIVRIEVIVFFALGIAAIVLNLRMAARYQRRLDDLDRIQQENS